MSTITSYVPFDIRFKPSSTGEITTSFASSQGISSARLGSLPTDLAVLDGAREIGDATHRCGETSRDLVRASRGTASHGYSNERLGGLLFEALFPLPALNRLEQAIASLESQSHRGLCIRLHFDLTDPIQARLSQLPWELLFRGDHGHFLAHSERTPIVRHLALPGSTPRFDLPPRLRILLVAAHPVDLEPLDLSLEVDKIQSSWEQDNVEVIVLRGDPAARGRYEDQGAQLREELRRGEYHVLHFMGHGTVEPDSQSGILFLESSEGTSSPIPGEYFARWLTNHRTLRLVVLNACSTGQPTSTTEAFLGVAPALVRAGVPGVLAMQAPIPDALATAFSRVLYQSLADGTPVEAALTRARVELYALRPAERLWSTPVLFTRDPQILRVPPKVGPALTKVWTFFGTSHLLIISVLHLRNRGVSAIPNMRVLLNGDVASVLGVLFGLPLFFLLLYLTHAYLKNVKLPKPAAQLSLARRVSLRLPVAFLARIQGRRLIENLYQFFFLIAFLIVPMMIQGHFFIDMMRATVWVRRTNEIFASGWEHFIRYAPLAESFDDSFRLGSIDIREHVRKELDSVTHVPFWEPWGLLLAQTVALCWLAILLWRLADGRDSE